MVDTFFKGQQEICCKGGNYAGPWQQRKLCTSYKKKQASNDWYSYVRSYSSEVIMLVIVFAVTCELK